MVPRIVLIEIPETVGGHVDFVLLRMLLEDLHRYGFKFCWLACLLRLVTLLFRSFGLLFGLLRAALLLCLLSLGLGCCGSDLLRALTVDGSCRCGSGAFDCFVFLCHCNAVYKWLKLQLNDDINDSQKDCQAAYPAQGLLKAVHPPPRRCCRSLLQGCFLVGLRL